jgi:HSP20 family protein
MSDKQPSGIVPSESSSPAPRSRNLDPFSVLSDMEMAMDRMFGRRWQFLRPLRRLTESSSGWAPQADMFEEGDSLVVKAELPGVAREDVEVMLDRGDLVIKGERKSEHEVKEENYYQMERSFGSFYRRLPMPEGVQADHLTASFKDGVLEVRTPKPATSGPSPTKIAIH